MRVILHIGLPKTGTKTIQWWLKINEKLLREGHRVYVPFSCLEPGTSINHVKLSVYARRDNRSDNIRSRLGIKSSDKLDDFRQNLEKSLADECRSGDFDIAILSSESCASRLFFDDEIRRLHNLASNIGRTEVVLYLRKQDELWASHYSTSVKLGYRQKIAPPSDARKREFLDFEGLCARWSQVFGIDKLKIRIFDARELRDGDLITDFLHASGLNLDVSSFRRPVRQNPSLDPKLLEFMRRFNEHLPYASGRTNFRPDPGQGNLMKIVEELSTGKRKLLGDWRQGLMAEFAESNRRVAREYLGRADGRLFPDDGDAETTEPDSDLSIDDAFEIFAKIWAAKHSADLRNPVAANTPTAGDVALLE